MRIRSDDDAVAPIAGVTLGKCGLIRAIVTGT
jgi:hypothetical protein